MRLAGLAAALVLIFGSPVLAATGDRLVVIANSVNVRAGPSLRARILMRVNRNRQVIELQRQGEWVRVELPGTAAEEGWIHGSLLALPQGERLAPPVGARVAPEPTKIEPAAPPQQATLPAAKPSPPQVAEPVPPAPEPAPPIVEAEPPVAKPSVPEAPAAESEPSVAASPPAPAPQAAPPAAPAAEPAPPAEVAAVPESSVEGVMQPPTIEPAAAPVAADLARFRQSVDYLNSRAQTVAGIDLFTGVQALGGGIVQVQTTDAWNSIPPAGQESYANALLDRWAAASGDSGPVSVQIVDANGRLLMQKARP